MFENNELVVLIWIVSPRTVPFFVLFIITSFAYLLTCLREHRQRLK